MKKIFSHVLSAALAVGFLFIALGSDDEKETEAAIANEAPAMTVSAEELYADYESNGVAADKKYKGKVLLVSGRVNNIDRDIMDDIYVTLTGDGVFGDVQCMFAEDHVNEAADLSKGQYITIKGKCDGKLMNVLMKGCSIQ